MPSEHQLDFQELGNIDYFLGNLARAVESGDVPIESYQRLAPRYLARRELLIARLYPPAVAPVAPPSGAAAVAPMPAPAPSTQVAPATAVPPASGSRPSVVTPAAHVAPAPKERREVPWPTVLTFLGAFLVIIAAAIFAAATWNVLPVMVKFGIMATLTAGFYVAGELVSRRLGLQVGGVALTVVGSAMLIFDGWILIDGFDLRGMLPWAVLLFVASVVYGLSEIRWGDGIFGVTSAAAQVAWFWLLGAGLGWPVIWRIAGIAAIALLWQLTSERAKRSEGVRTLAVVLSWAAPVVSVGSVLYLVYDLLLAPADLNTTVCAAVITTSAAVVLYRQTIVPRTAGAIVASLAQLPMLAALVQADAITGASLPTPWRVVALAVFAVVWGAAAIVLDEPAFAVVSCVAQILVVYLTGALLSWPRLWRATAIAELVLGWQVLTVWVRSERMRRVRTTLGWAVVVVSAGCVLGFAADTFIARAQVSLAIAGILTSISLGIALYFDRVLPESLRRTAAAIAQLAVCFVLLGDVSVQWWQIWSLAGLAVVWLAIGLFDAGAPFVAVSGLAQLAALGMAGELVHSPPPSGVWAFAGLATLQFVVATLVGRTDFGSSLRRARETVVTERVVGLAMLFIAAVESFSAADVFPGSPVSLAIAASSIGLLACVVFAAWEIGGSIMPVVAVVALQWAAVNVSAWALHDAVEPAFAVLPLLASSAVLLASKPIARFFRSVEGSVEWTARVFVLIWIASGCLLALGGSTQMRAATSAVVIGIAVVSVIVLVGDGLMRRSRSHGAVVSDMVGAGLAAAAASTVPGAVFEQYALSVLGVGCAALVMVGLAVGLRRLLERAPVLALAVSSLAPAVFIGAADSTTALIGVPLQGDAYAWAPVAGIVATAVACGLAVLATSFDAFALPAVAMLVGTAVEIVARTNVPPAITVVVFGVTAFAMLAASTLPPLRPAASHPLIGASFAYGGYGALGVPVLVGLSAMAIPPAELARWARLDSHMLAASFVLLGAYSIGLGIVRRHEGLAVYGTIAFVFALWVEFANGDLGWIDYYALPLAVYVGGCAEYVARRRRSVRTGQVLGVVAVLILVLPPILSSFAAGSPREMWIHAAVAFFAGLLAVGAGVVFRVRAYFFGGAAAVAFVAAWRAFVYLSQWWWLVLGLVGITMLIIALTWEFQRRVLTETRQMASRSFLGWR